MIATPPSTVRKVTPSRFFNPLSTKTLASATPAKNRPPPSQKGMHALNTPTTSDHSASPTPPPVRADDETRARHEREAQSPTQRWPVPQSLRAGLLKVALSICGLKTTADGQVEKTDEDPRPAPRDKLATMRMIASYDKLSIDERKLDLRENPSGEKPVPKRVDDRHVSSATVSKCLSLLIKADSLPRKPKPPVEPEFEEAIELESSMLDARWPLSMAIRSALVAEAATPCGLSITGQGTVEPIPVTDETPAPRRRIVLAALRVFARFDRLSIEHRRVEWRRKQYLAKHPRDNDPDPYPEISAEIHALMEEDDRFFREFGYFPSDAEGRSMVGGAKPPAGPES